MQPHVIDRDRKTAPWGKSLDTGHPDVAKQPQTDSDERRIPQYLFYGDATGFASDEVGCLCWYLDATALAKG